MRGSILVLICLVVPVPGAADAAGEDNLFFIQRSKNRNEVHYDAIIEDCRWVEPLVKGYWRDLEEGPDVISPITFWEKRLGAYGFEAERVTDSGVEIRHDAVSDRPITAELTADGRDCDIDVEITLKGEAARLRHVYVHATERPPLWPRVDCVDIHGTDPKGQPVVERIERGRGCHMPVSKPVP